MKQSNSFTIFEKTSLLTQIEDFNSYLHCSSMNKFLISATITFLLALHSYGYYQQQVDYRIKVKLVTALNRLEGSEKIIYYNNSADSLNHIYFHLYINRYRQTTDITELPYKKYGYQEIIYVRDSDNRDLFRAISGTIMKVTLAHALAPGDSQAIHIRFNTILTAPTDRFGYYGYHYDIGNWYPVPAVYDQYGWHTDQHFDGEFYQEWGNYWVDITVPKGFVVGATGVLQNPEVLPDSVTSVDRTYNYNEWSDNSMVTYKYHAAGVHDFAWSADPEFVLRTLELDSLIVHFLILRYQVKEWESQLDVVRQCLEIFEGKIGPYTYPTLTIVDGYITAGGIEYPNLVIINDRISDPRSLSAIIIHEIAHQWFYGILANNQTRYGWMDEGFATFFENLAVEEIFGSEKTFVPSPAGFWGKYFGYWEDLNKSDFLIYLRYIKRGHEEPINRHYDWFLTEPYTPYYQKMGLVISQLKLVLGDSLFWKSIKYYYESWKYKHPYPKDMFAAFENASGRRLNWFFDQWLNTTWYCDYGVKSIKGRWHHQGNDRVYKSQIEFKRIGQIVMPLDFVTFFEDGNTKTFRIPVGDGENFFEEKTAGIEPWLFTEKEKSVVLKLPDKVKAVRIDPDKNLLDVNPFNDDSRTIPQIYLHWMKRQYLFPHINGYTTAIMPIAFYNQIDGVQVGFRSIGNFLYSDYRHRLRLLLGFNSWLPEAEFEFEHPLYQIDRRINLAVELYHLAGRSGVSSWIKWTNDNFHRPLQLRFGWQWRHLYDSSYLPYPAEEGNISYLEIMLKKGWWQDGYLPAGLEFCFQVESSFLGSQYNYQKWLLSGNFRFPLLWSRNISGIFYTGGVYDDSPLQKSFRFGGASTYDFISNPYLRAKGTLPSSWWREGNVFEEGGGSLRSYSNVWEPAGKHLISGYFSIDVGYPMNLTNLHFPIISDVLFSIYTAWAAASDHWGQYSNFLGETGFSFSITRLPFVLNYFDLTQIHFDFPIWVNDHIDNENLKFRWTVGLQIEKFN